MLEVLVCKFGDLTSDEQENASNNGNGKESASYLRVVHNGETILLESSAMDPEDVSFRRDLRWVADALKKVYELGKGERDDTKTVDDNQRRT